MASFVPVGGFHPVIEQAAADASLAKSAGDAAVKGAGAGTSSGGGRHVNDIAFHHLSNSSSNGLF
jgi:hypothetical protein